MSPSIDEASLVPEKKKKKQQQQQQPPALLHTGTYMFVDHKSKRLKSMDFIVSCSK